MLKSRYQLYIDGSYCDLGWSSQLGVNYFLTYGQVEKKETKPECRKGQTLYHHTVNAS